MNETLFSELISKQVLMYVFEPPKFLKPVLNLSKYGF